MWYICMINKKAFINSNKLLITYNDCLGKVRQFLSARVADHTQQLATIKLAQIIYHTITIQ